MSAIEGIEPEVLKRYLVARKTITKHADRIVAVSHLLSLLEHCGDDVIEVSPMALVVVADLVNSDICSIQEQLDEFIFVLDAEEALGQE